MEDTVAMVLASVAVGFLGVILTVLLMLFRLIGKTDADLRQDMNAKHTDLREDMNAKHADLKADIAELRTGQTDIRGRLRNLELDVAVLKSHALGLGPFMVERDARTRSAGEAAPEQAVATTGPD